MSIDSRTYARTRYSFCSDWKLNLSGTMKGLFTRARTSRSARVCVISPRSTMCCFRMVFSAYIRDVSRLRTCMTWQHSSGPSPHTTQIVRTFPKLPFPMTVISSKSSIVKDWPCTDC